MQKNAVAGIMHLPVKWGFILEIQALGGRSYSTSTGGEISGKEPQDRRRRRGGTDRGTDKNTLYIYVPYILEKLLSL